MDDHHRSSTSTPKPAVLSPSQLASPDIKSPTSARPLYSSKLGDQKSRLSASPADNSSSTSSQANANRQAAASQKAWTGAKNPITGRSQPPQTGLSSANKHSPTAALREGQKVRFTLTNGAEFEGIYASNPADASSCYLKMVQPKKGQNTTDTTNGASRRDGNMPFQRKDIADARVVSNNNKNNGRIQNGDRAGFRTDAAISSSRGGIERDLERWVPDTGKDVDGSMSLEKGTGPAWDQFAANESLFGLKTDYDESIYTTPINKAHPDYHQRMFLAEKKAREIERSAPITSHHAEERQADNAGGEDTRDEAQKYSDVGRPDFPPLQNRENKYTPPARRAPTGHTTVKGAPVDPAIISSQLKAPSQKPGSKSEENKIPGTAGKPSTTTTAEVKVVEPRPEAKPEAKTDPKLEAKAEDSSKEAATQTGKLGLDTKSSAAAALRPSATTSRTISPQNPQNGPSNPPNATATVTTDVLREFKTFASKERATQEKARIGKAKADKEGKLSELRKFGESFKLATPVPNDLIGIIAKDPEKQKKIQERAMQDAQQVAARKAKEAAVAAQQEKQASASKDSQPKVSTEPTTTTTAAPSAAGDSRTAARPTAPQHSSSPSTVSGRQPGARQSNYQTQHYQQNYRGRQNQHLGGQQGQQPLPLGERIRQGHRNHMVADNMRGVPPTGPANNVEAYQRRLSGLPPSHLKQLNPNSNEFRPSGYAPAFNPAGPSQASSPRSAYNVAETPVAHGPPAAARRGQLIRRKTKAVDVNKCNILLHLKTIQPPPGVSWDENLGLRPAYQTPATWRQVQDGAEKQDSTMHLTYKEYFDSRPIVTAAAATPGAQHTMPLTTHHQQLPFSMQQQGGLVPRPSPQISQMPMHNGPHGHIPHAPYPGNPDDHRMMQSNSAQSFASPRPPQQMPLHYAPQGMNMPGAVPYPQQNMGPYMNAAPQQMPQQQYRHFSQGQYPQQQHNMGTPMMIPQPGFMTPAGMIPAGQPPMAMYPAAVPQYIQQQGGPPASVGGQNGYHSPGRPAAPMMAPQGSHQGQQFVYGASPGIQFQQPMYHPQQPQPPKYGRP